MAYNVKAKQGDSLCSIAIRVGRFADCQKLRDASENTELKDRQVEPKEKVFVPDLIVRQDDGTLKKKNRWLMKKGVPPAIRFVHGSPSKDWKDDHALKVLQVSNYHTEKAGLKQDQAFPTTYGYDKDAHVDPDTFKIEVTDSSAGGNTLTVSLEALKPLYLGDGTIEYDSFGGTDGELTKRKVDVDCERVAAGRHIFRSKYLRLVTDTGDFDAIPDQALLVADTADGKNGIPDWTEILDQQVRATYALPNCPKAGDAAAACRVACQLPVGKSNRRKRIKLMVHVLRSVRDGAGVITDERARFATLKYNRRIFAQAELSVKMVKDVRYVQPPANLIAIENVDGNKAAGGKKIKLRIRVNPDAEGNDTTKDIDYDTRSGDRPIETAKRLANLIASDFDKHVRVRYSANPPCRGKARGSADVIVGDPLKQVIEITPRNAPGDNDPTHRATIGSIVGGNVPDFDDGAVGDWHVGTLEERTLIKNYDTGKTWIDVFIVQALGSGALGEGFIRHRRRKRKNQRTRDLLVNTVVVNQATVGSPDQYQAAYAHEIGHVLTDLNHITSIGGEAARKDWELMMGLLSADCGTVDAQKRISDASNAQLFAEWDDTGNPKGSPVKVFRGKSTSLLESW